MSEAFLGNRDVDWSVQIEDPILNVDFGIWDQTYTFWLNSCVNFILYRHYV